MTYLRKICLEWITPRHSLVKLMSFKEIEKKGKKTKSFLRESNQTIIEFSATVYYFFQVME